MKYAIRILSIVIVTSIFFADKISAQISETLTIFQDVPVNFNGDVPKDPNIERYQDGRILLKKIQAPTYENGTDVSVKVVLRSEGDPWDKSGSLFVLSDTSQIELRDILKGSNQYPEESAIGDYPGIIKTNSYTPPLEILRFMTPFGAGYFSDEVAHPRIRYNRPVYIPTWKNQVTWEENVSDLASELTGEFYIGVWIDTWTDKGYAVDVELTYTGRPLVTKSTIPLVNTIYYAGQKHPDLFAFQPLMVNLTLNEYSRNIKLHFITTGHGGHSGGDEFIKISNRV